MFWLAGVADVTTTVLIVPPAAQLMATVDIQNYIVDGGGVDVKTNKNIYVYCNFQYILYWCFCLLSMSTLNKNILFMAMGVLDLLPVCASLAVSFSPPLTSIQTFLQSHRKTFPTTLTRN